jgi:hypothetical protein
MDEREMNMIVERRKDRMIGNTLKKRKEKSDETKEETRRGKKKWQCISFSWNRRSCFPHTLSIVHLAVWHPVATQYLVFL